MSSVDDVLLDGLVQVWAADAEAADLWGDYHLPPDDHTPPPPLTRADADAVVAAVLAAGPGPWAASMLLTVSPADLSGPVRFDLQRAWQAQQAWTDAQAALSLADHLGPPPHDAHHELTVPDHAIGWRMRLAETALVLACSESTLRRRAAVCHDLTRRLPATRAALLAGTIGWYHAMIVSESLTGLPDVLAAEAEARVVCHAERVSAGRLRRRLRAELARADTTGRAEHAALTGRRVQRGGSPDDGEAFLTVWSTPRDIQAMWKTLTTLAGPADTTDPRPIGARRVDALLGLCLAATTPTGHPDADTTVGRTPPRRTNPPVEVQVVVDLATLTGLADHPAELRGHGPVPAGVVRDWLTDATCWRRLVTDPVTGHLLDYGPRVRFAPRSLKAFLNARDQTCTFPGCHQPAERCDLDHQPPWQTDGTGGHTSANHLAPLCRHHHQWKTHHGWTLQRLPDGTSHWTSPTGRTYDVLRRPTLGAEWQPDP